jgi:hypothetical protein
VLIRLSLPSLHPTPSCLSPRPKAVWLLIRLPLLQRTLVGLPRRFLSLSPAKPHALTPCAAHLRGSHQRGCSSVHPLPQRARWDAVSCPSPIASRATCPRSALLAPSPLGAPLTTPWPRGAHVPWRLKSSQAKSRAPTSVGDAGGARAPRLTASSHSDGQNRLARPSLPYVPYVYFKCSRHFRFMLQFFHLDIAKVDRRMLQVFQRHVSIVC